MQPKCEGGRRKSIEERRPDPRRRTDPSGDPARRSASVSLPRLALFLAHPAWPVARQTPGGALAWGDCRFEVNPAAGTFDGCAVYDGLPGPARIACPRDRTLFIAGEPPSIKEYDERFLAQFHAVLTCHSDTPHPRRIADQQAYLWYAGVRRVGGRAEAALGYDDFA